jgi:hypothetical protein
MLEKFHKEARTDAQHALAFIKCEPVWSKSKLLYETAPEYIRIIEEALLRLEKLEDKPKPTKGSTRDIHIQKSKAIVELHIVRDYEGNPIVDEKGNPFFYMPKEKGKDTSKAKRRP